VRDADTNDDTMSSSRIAAALVLATLASPTAALADPDADPIGWAPPTSPTLTRSLDVAYDFWTRRHVTPPARATLVVQLADIDVAGMADFPGNHIWINARWFREVTRSRRDLTHRRELQRGLCHVVVHELGHASGVNDTTTAGSMMNGATQLAPWECRKAFPLPRRRPSAVRPIG
jgi:hypothetical protein